MDKFVPLDKKSKKAQKEFHARQRRSWEGISPLTRTVPNGKAYNRKKMKADERRSSRDFRNETTAAFLMLAGDGEKAGAGKILLIWLILWYDLLVA